MIYAHNENKMKCLRGKNFIFINLLIFFFNLERYFKKTLVNALKKALYIKLSDVFFPFFPPF